MEHLLLTALADVWAHNPEVQEEISVDILTGGFLHARKLNLPCYSFLLLKRNPATSDSSLETPH